MCVQAAVIAAAAAVVSAGIAGYSAIQQGNAAEATSEYNAQVALMKARQQEEAARTTIQQGQEAERAQRRKVAQILGYQQAAYGAAGVDQTFGSPLKNLTATLTQGELDALTVRNNARSQANSFLRGAGDARAQASLELFSGAAQKQASTLNAVGSLVSGIGAAASVWGSRPNSSVYGPVKPSLLS